MKYLEDFCVICFRKDKPLIRMSTVSEGLTLYSKLTITIPQMCFDEMNNQSSICDECCKNVNSSYDFRQKCLRSKPILINYLKELGFVVESNPDRTGQYEEHEPDHADWDKHREDTEANYDNVAISETHNRQYGYNNEMTHNRNEITEKIHTIDIVKHEPGVDLSCVKNELLSDVDQSRIETPSNIVGTITLESSEPVEDYDLTFAALKRELQDPLQLTDKRAENDASQIDEESQNDDESQNDGPQYSFVCDVSSDTFTGSNSDISALEPETIIITDSGDERLHVESFKNSTGERITGLAKHGCKICGRHFIRVSHLRRHERIHTGKKPHLCKVCGKSFMSVSYLKNHDRVHTGEKPYQCNLCGKGFTQLGNLKTHELVHTGMKPFKCKECGRGFTQLGNLKTHQLVHSGKKPFKCTQCPKGFTQLGNLRSHEFSHGSPKPYRCTKCGKGFSQLSSLRSHEVIHLHFLEADGQGTSKRALS